MTKLQQQGSLYAYFNEHLELSESQHKMPVTWMLQYLVGVIIVITTLWYQDGDDNNGENDDNNHDKSDNL